MSQQITDTILMVRPANFGFNPQTAESNTFQNNSTDLSPEQIQILATQEFDQFVQRLQQEDIRVIVVQDSTTPKKYDAIFPNNWITTHEDGIIITYPMTAPMRRLERREEIITALSDEFKTTQRLRLERYENEGKMLEGTGSMILDRSNKIVYACQSDRTDEQVLEEFCATLGYKKVFFHAVDANDHPIYHTNVMMALGETFAIICLEAVKDGQEWANLHKTLTETGKEIIEISFEQMASFAGNMLQVKNKWGDTYLVMSEQAYRVLKEKQIERIKAHTLPLYSPLYIIEQFGGGSARCMMAEIFLPKNEG